MQEFVQEQRHHPNGSARLSGCTLVHARNHSKTWLGESRPQEAWRDWMATLVMIPALGNWGRADGCSVHLILNGGVHHHSRQSMQRHV
eukprot:scaffold180447_cov34-Tisochrysis_lutea.AAC.3